MGALSRFAHAVLGDYALYFVYRCDTESPGEPVQQSGLIRVSEGDLTAALQPVIAEQAWYLGSGCEAFGLADEGGIGAVCFYWHGERYRQQRNFWPLADHEAKLVQIVVDPTVRGRGLATRLITASAAAMGSQGWSTLYARIWHSNAPSLRAFERAGWIRVAFVAEVFPFGMSWKIRLQFPWFRRRDRQRSSGRCRST